jgi:type III secretory pathway component EscT
MADQRDPRRQPENGDIFLGEGGFRSVVPAVTESAQVVACVKECLEKMNEGDQLIVMEYHREAFLRWASTAMVYRRHEELNQ